MKRIFQLLLVILIGQQVLSQPIHSATTYPGATNAAWVGVSSLSSGQWKLFKVRLDSLGSGGSSISLPFSTNKYYNGYGNFTNLRLDSVIGGNLVSGGVGFPKVTTSPLSAADLISEYFDSASHKAIRYPSNTGGGFIRSFIPNITANRTLVYPDVSDTFADRAFVRGLATNTTVVQKDAATVGTRGIVNFVTPTSDRTFLKVTDVPASFRVDVTVQPKWNFEWWFTTRGGGSGLPFANTGLSASTGNTANSAYMGGTLWDATTATTGRVAVGFSQNSVLLGDATRTYRAEIVADCSPLGAVTNTDYHLYAGFFNNFESAGAAPTDGCWIDYYWNTNAGKFVCTCANNSVLTSVNSNTAFVAGTSYTYKVEVFNGVANFFVNGTNIGTVSTNVPTARSTGLGFTVYKVAGATDVLGSIRRIAASWNVE